MTAKWNAATRYSAHPFTTKTGARVLFFAWIIHESEDGTKHVFTLLVVEMVRGIYISHVCYNAYDMYVICKQLHLCIYIYIQYMNMRL